MFGILKKKLKEAVQKLNKKVDVEEAAEKPDEKKPEKEIRKKDVSLKKGKTERKPISKKYVDDEKPVEVIEQEIEHIKEEQEGVGEDGEERATDELAEEEEESVKEPVTRTHTQLTEEIEEELHIKRGGLFGLKEKFVKKITVKKLTEQDIEEFFSDLETDLLEANVALDVVDFLKTNLKEKLVNREIKRGNTVEQIKKVFEDSLFAVVNQGSVDLEGLIKKKVAHNKPAVIVFIGFNGAGKTTSIAKLGNFLKSKGHRPVLAAGDTFRAAAIQQLEHHAEKIGLKVVTHDYGADAAAVIFDAVKHAEAKGADVVLADTAGRTHSNVNLVDELKKIVRVNKPDLKVLVLDGLTGNDAVLQAEQFDKEVGVDAVVITKVDVDEKGGAILSVAYAIKKPILFLGVGQKYGDFELFEPRKFVESLLE